MNIPFLKNICLFKKKNAVPVDKSTYLLTPDAPFAIAEAYRMLRTNIMYSAGQEGTPIYAITSAMPHEGKSINCSNIAISFAHAGKRVLLIDGDMRNPTVAPLFKESSKNGLSEYLASVVPEPNFIPSKYENLTLMVAGHKPPNPAELLGNKRIAELFEIAREKFDYIFIDLPPVNMISDATILAKDISGYLFVVDSGHTHSGAVKRALDSIRMVGGSVIGFALNRVNPKKSDGALYGYKSYGYSRRYYKNYYNRYNTKNSDVETEEQETDAE
ncbi:MAG: CpsD/CapB family tyrosine-protein kinase [Clostridia bacterium]|nr:CpsD/CapB family tyrosine-protein kinase [Clostridia bacterium]